MIGKIYIALWAVSEHFRAGGPVMAPLALVSLVLALLCAHKALELHRMSRLDANRAQAAQWVARGGLMSPPNPHGAATVLVERFLARRTGTLAGDKRILREIEHSLAMRLDGRLAVIGAMAQVAPLLGLLGTVLGMMAAFDVLAVFGAGNAMAMANSISQALITTETGLLIAIPGVYMKGFLEKKAERIKTRLSRIVIHLGVHSLPLNPYREQTP